MDERTIKGFSWEDTRARLASSAYRGGWRPRIGRQIVGSRATQKGWMK